MDQEGAFQASQDRAFQGVDSLGAVLLEEVEAHPEAVRQVVEEEETSLGGTPLQSSTVIAPMRITL